MFQAIFGGIIAPMLIVIGAILVLWMIGYLFLPAYVKGEPHSSVQRLVCFIVGLIFLVVGIISHTSYKKTQENIQLTPVASDYKVYLELDTTEISSLIYDITLVDDEEKIVWVKPK